MFAFVGSAACLLDRATHEICQFCTFGQAMVQSLGPGLFGASNLKELQIACGQTMVQKRPLVRSSHRRSQNPQGGASRSRSPQSRQRAGLFPCSPCPREGAAEKGNDRRNQVRKQRREMSVSPSPRGQQTLVVLAVVSVGGSWVPGLKSIWRREGTGFSINWRTASKIS